MKNSLINRIIKKSYEIASQMDFSYRHISFIVSKGNILSYGQNHPTKTHPAAKSFKYRYPYIHAELAALVRFPYNPSLLKGCSLVNTRVGMNGELALSRPCQNCQQMIVAMGFKRVLYTNEFGLFEEFLF